MADLTYKIIQNLGVISTDSKWKKELNIVKWGDNDPKFDLRSWNEDHTRSGKGITLSAEDICDLRIPFLLDRRYGRIQRKLLLQRLRRGQFPDQLHTLFHRSYSLLPFKIVKIDFIKNQLCIIAYLEQFA